MFILRVAQIVTPLGSLHIYYIYLNISFFLEPLVSNWLVGNVINIFKLKTYQTHTTVIVITYI